VLTSDSAASLTYRHRKCIRQLPLSLSEPNFFERRPCGTSGPAFLKAGMQNAEAHDEGF
jgi:hypothetical protein